MAAPVVVSPLATISESPFLIRKGTFTAGNTATAFSHGGPAVAPDIAFTQNSSVDPTASESSITSLTTTQFTLDCEAGSGTITVYLMWLAQGAGGLTSLY